MKFVPIEKFRQKENSVKKMKILPFIVQGWMTGIKKLRLVDLIVHYVRISVIKNNLSYYLEI